MTRPFSVVFSALFPSPREERGEGGAKRRVRGRATCQERPLTLTLSPRKKRAGRGDFPPSVTPRGVGLAV
jgi:hypothetical protein